MKYHEISTIMDLQTNLWLKLPWVVPSFSRLCPNMGSPKGAPWDQAAGTCSQLADPNIKWVMISSKGPLGDHRGPHASGWIYAYIMRIQYNILYIYICIHVDMLILHMLYNMCTCIYIYIVYFNFTSITTIPLAQIIRISYQFSQNKNAHGAVYQCCVYIQLGLGPAYLIIGWMMLMQNQDDKHAVMNQVPCLVGCLVGSLGLNGIGLPPHLLAS